MMNKYAIILAAGKGTRMKSKLYKVLHKVCGTTMVEHVLSNVKAAGVTDVVTVVGHGAETVKSHLGEASHFVLQEQQLGTAHAVKQAENLLKDKEGITIVLCGDTPLISSETINAMIERHIEMKAKATILTAITDDPTGYGRIIRNSAGLVEKIVEQKDGSPEELKIKEINSGTYCFDNKALFDTLSKVNNDNAQGEYYLPDVIGILKEQGEVVTAHVTADFDETLGINDRVALSQAEQIMKRRINHEHMLNGVTIIDPENTYIGKEVVIGADTIIYPGSTIFGRTVIGEDCLVEGACHFDNAVLGNSVKVSHSVITNSTVGHETTIGPYAHLRQNCEIGDKARIGNFVEMKKAKFGNEAKSAHLTYVGDATVGERTNLGCGTVTVNYDGKDKHHTTIGKDAFIGCNSVLISPVHIGDEAITAAGSVISKDVPQGALAIARSKQENKEGYAAKLPPFKKKYLL